MPQRFESQFYTAETTRLMKDAFEAARRKVELVENNPGLTDQLLASAIIDQVNAGVRELETIVAGAVATMAVARKRPGLTARNGGHVDHRCALAQFPINARTAQSIAASPERRVGTLSGRWR
jgi:hypothetical protein